MVPISYYLILSGLLFAIGAAGVLLRRNVIVLLHVDRADAERREPDLRRVRPAAGTVDGQIIAFFVMTVAAAEAAVGLAIVIALFRHRESLNADAFTTLKW